MFRSITSRLLGGVASIISQPTTIQQAAAAAVPGAGAAAAAVLQAQGLLCARSAAGMQQLALGSVLGMQPLHTSACTAAGAASVQQQPQHYVRLDRLHPAPGSSKLAKRWGRGNASDRGKTCGRGTKGQKSRKGGKPHILFDGGQKTLTKFPKVWLTASSPMLYHQLGLSKVLRWVRLGLLDAGEVITMKDLRDSGCAPKTIRWGVELVANGSESVDVPLHLAVSSVSPAAKSAVEAAGGSVTRVYYTRLGLRALLKPENFAKQGFSLPRPVRAWPPRDNGKYDVIGQLPPTKQLPGTTSAVAAGSAGS